MNLLKVLSGNFIQGILWIVYNSIVYFIAFIVPWHKFKLYTENNSSSTESGKQYCGWNMLFSRLSSGLACIEHYTLL